MNYEAGRFGRDFNTSFTIPRMRGNNEGHRNMHQPVLEDSYANIPRNYPQYSNPSEPQNFNNQCENNWEMFTRRPWTNNRTSTPEQPANNYQQTSLKRTWQNANATKRSVPAVPAYKATFGDLYDPTLPKDLLALFQPLYCKLCTAQLSSNVMAKTHYKSKNHDKKVRVWLTEYSEKTGEPLHQRAALPRPKKEEEYDPKYFHCDVCDLNLTGKIHAESHYMGRHHQRALHGKKKPSGKGFINDDGKWVRTVAAKDDPTGRDGFGQDFALQEKITKVLKTDENTTKPTKPDNCLKCEICDVVVTSVAQLDMHLQGQKHKKKIKHMEDGMTIATIKNDDAGVGGIAPTKSADSDMLSSYRTPSGHFYCKTCNLSVNSEVQFMQHLKSKKHSKKLTAPASPPSLSTSSVPEELLTHL